MMVTVAMVVTVMVMTVMKMMTIVTAMLGVPHLPPQPHAPTAATCCRLIDRIVLTDISKLLLGGQITDNSVSS